MLKKDFNIIVKTAFTNKISIKDACEKLGYSHDIISNHYPKQLALAIDAWIRINVMQKA